MIGAVSIHQPSLGLNDLQRLYQRPTGPQSVPPVQPTEAPAVLDIQDRTSFTSRQGRVPAVQVKLFDDAPQQVSQSKPMIAQVRQAAPSQNVTHTNLDHSRITSEQIINPQPYTQEKGSLDGRYHVTSHVMASQQHQQQEGSADSSSQKHQVFKPQQQQQLKAFFKDIKDFAMDVIVPGSSQQASGRISQAAARTVAPRNLYSAQGRFSTVI